MPTISLNPDNLKVAIQDLRDLADDCETAASDIDTEFEAEHDPMDLGTFTGDATAKVSAVRDRADDVESVMNNIITLNDSGVATMDPHGYITYELPGGADVSTTEAWSTYTQAAVDAYDLTTITSGGSASDGRSYDEVIESITSRQADAHYADALITCIGPENLTSLPLAAVDHFTVKNTEYGDMVARPGAGTDLAALLGTVLASASTSWGLERAQQVASAIAGSVDEKGEWGRITALNAMLGGHDADSDHVNDLVFDSNFLVDLATELEAIDWTTIARYAGWTSSSDSDIRMVADQATGPHLSGQSFDPLAGVLDAMGNNPTAALDYLAPEQLLPSGDGAGTVDTTQIVNLAQRSWDQAGLSGFTAALAAGSSQRSSQRSFTAQRADELTGHAIAGLAGHTDPDDYDDDAKARIGLLLANCRAELTNAWTGGTALDPNTLRVLPGVSREDLSTLAYGVVDSADATTTIAAQLAQYAREQSQAGIAANEGNSEAQIDAINTKYIAAGQATGVLTGLADARAAEINKDAAFGAASATSNAQLATSVLATVVGAGLGSVGGPVGTVAGSAAGRTAWSVGTTLLKPLIGFDASEVGSTLSASSAQDGLWAAAVQDAANAGLLKPSDFEVGPPSGTTWSWLQRNPDGSYSIDLSAADPEDDPVAQMHDWVNIVNSPRRENDPTFTEITDDFHEAFGDGQDRGHETEEKAQ